MSYSTKTMAIRWGARMLAVCAIAATAELVVPRLSYAQSDSSSPRTLGVSAIGRATTPADKAVLLVQYKTNFYNDRDPETGITLQPEINFSDVKPVVDALVSAGISESAISSSEDPYTENLRLVIQVNNPTQMRLRQLVDLATKTTLQQGKFVAGTATVVYTVADCDRAEAAAYKDAVSNLEQRAAVLADEADVEVGDLLAISSYTASWGGLSSSSQVCPRTVGDAIEMTQYGGQRYDLAMPAEVPVDVNISATFEIE